MILDTHWHTGLTPLMMHNQQAVAYRKKDSWTELDFLPLQNSLS